MLLFFFHTEADVVIEIDINFWNFYQLKGLIYILLDIDVLIFGGSK